MLEKRKGIPSLKGYYTAKSGEVFHYDSLSELAVMMYYDERNYEWYKNTKLRIPYTFEGVERKYIPDFIVGGELIVEIKGSKDKPELVSKIKAARNYCLQHNATFELIDWEKVKTLVDWNKVKEYHYQHIKK